MPQPESFDEDLMTDWSRWVLDHGLAQLPPRVDRGESVPVARWVGPTYAAVLHVRWTWGDPEEDDELLSEVQVFARADGSWEQSLGSGGTGWLDPPFQRPAAMAPRSAALVGGHCSGRDSWYCCSVFGIAGSEAAFVEVVDGDGMTRRSVESPFGAFVVGSDGWQRARVRVRDNNERVLLEENFGADTS